MEILLFLFWMFTKHLIVDFPLQSNWMAFNKANFRHPGGYVHAGLHGLGTLMILYVFGVPLWLSLVDFVVHYVVDYTKMNLNSKFSWNPRTHAFWWSLGVDQYLHALTYLGISLFLT